MDIAAQMILFAKVVDHASFSATARTLGLTPSAVSKQITSLETRLGVRLLNRSTRHISLTQEGQSFYRRCANIAAEVSEAEQIAAAMGKSPTGKLRVAATVAFSKAQLLPLLPEFLEAHPDISISMELTDRHVDLSANDYDLAIRFSEQLNSASVVVRKLAENQRVVCAAPNYLARHGMLRTPDDLAQHNCLRISTVEDWNDWHFNVDGRAVVVHAQGNFDANSADAIYHATLAGVGIARLSTYMVAEDVRAGRLVHLLPDQMAEDASIFAVYASKHQLSPKIRVFLDYLTNAIGPIPPWDQKKAA